MQITRTMRIRNDVSINAAQDSNLVSRQAIRAIRQLDAHDSLQAEAACSALHP
jgi:hypothetical protein